MTGPFNGSDQVTQLPTAADHSSGATLSDSLSPQDYAKYHGSKSAGDNATATNKGTNVLPPMELAHHIKDATASNDPAKLQQAAHEVNDAAMATYVNSQGSADALKQFQNDVNSGLQGSNTMIEASIKLNSVNTHIDQRLADSDNSHTMARWSPETGKVDDLTDSVSTKLPQELQQLYHKLQPNDGSMVTKLAHEQQQKLHLSDDQESKLERALNLVGNANTQETLNQLGSMIPELADPNSNLGRAFSNALQEIGYKPSIESSGNGSYHMLLNEPRPGGFGGGSVDISYTAPKANETKPTIEASHATYRAF